jgi:hypothetical protein
MERIGIGLNGILSRNLSGGTEKNHENSVKADNTAEIRKKHHSNACLERYLWPNFYGSLVTSYLYDVTTIPR